MRSVGGSWRELLGRGAAVHRLSDDDQRTWTPLQYGCHVRDVCKMYEDRSRQMLKKRKPPTFTDWDYEAEVVKSDYAAQDPDKVAYELATNAGKYADLLDRVGGDEWDKQGVRADGSPLTVDSAARMALHDMSHHLWDARQQIEG